MGKKAASKVPVSKQVWQWTESVQPEDITEEHVHTAYRLKLDKCNTCRKNCPGNPRCLKGLGESYWLRERSQQNASTVDLDLNEGQRKEGEFVGLRNLGATCYVNTFLQLWFHNLNFRSAVYKFHGKDNASDDDKSPNSVCRHLQLIFGLLQCSERKNIDPSPLIACLGLDTGLQQDAQEFSKLFLNLLQSVSTVGDFLCEEFCGGYDYHTTCHTCGHVSVRPSKFYELDLSIQGHKDILQCLGEFFKEEQLNSDNQYHCDSCKCKRDASRKIVVRSLPTTLNLQLLRFVFDKTTWNKKKLSTVVSFPNTLDMSSFVSSENVSPEDMTYKLTAVLIHRGPSASSGHYIAHIKYSPSQLWYKFNDESILQMKSGKKLDLDAPAEDDYEADMLPKPSKKPRLKKDHHSSKNAYMLVYTRKKNMSSDENPLSVPELPEHVKVSVDKDNGSFRSSLEEIKMEAKKLADEEEKNHNQMSALVKSMYEAESESVCWVPSTWLKQTLNPSHMEKNSFTIDKFLCSHKKLDPERVGSLKRISELVAQQLFAICKEESPNVSNSMLCHECVKDRCISDRLKASLKVDHAVVTKLLKEDNQVEEYYVGRSSLRYWKTMALRADRDKQQSDQGGQSLETNENKVEEPEERNGNNVDGNESEEEEDLNFNEDLLCEHANLTTDSKEYRAVSSQVWDILVKYFPDSPCYRTTHQSCGICCDKEHDAAQSIELRKVIVTEQKDKLHSLFIGRNRPNYEDVYDSQTCRNKKEPSFYVLSSKFVGKWRECLKNPLKHDLVYDLDNQTLLCPHNKLICDPVLSSRVTTDDYQTDLFADDRDPTTVLLWPHEWDYISKNFIVDIPIGIHCQLVTHTLQETVQNGCDEVTVTEKNNLEDIKDGVNVGDVKNSQEESVRSEVRVQISDSNNASEVKVNIKPELVKQTPKQQSIKVKLTFKPEICMECIEGRQLERERCLRNYTDAEIYVRKVIPENKSNSDPAAFIPKEVSQSSEVFARRSGQASEVSARRSRRAHTTRGEKKMTVSSDWTLKQLKIKIMSLFAIPPFDQNIWLAAKKLSEDEATLGTLSIIPGCTLLVVPDEPDEKLMEMLPVLPPKEKYNLEEGFKGTNLLTN